MSQSKANLQWTMHVEYAQPQGKLYSQFMQALKDKKFLGTKINGKKYFPVKQFCSETFAEPDEVIESDGVGFVESFTIYHKDPDRVNFPNAHSELKPPYVVAAIRVSNSEQCFMHYLSGVEAHSPSALLQKVKAGLLVKPVWAEDRHGNILDILHYEPMS